MQALLLTVGADINKDYSNGATALISAAAEGHEVVVQGLLAAGADFYQANSEGTQHYFCSREGAAADCAGAAGGRHQRLQKRLWWKESTLLGRSKRPHGCSAGTAGCRCRCEWVKAWRLQAMPPCCVLPSRLVCPDTLAQVPGAGAP